MPARPGAPPAQAIRDIDSLFRMAIVRGAPAFHRHYYAGAKSPIMAEDLARLCRLTACQLLESPHAPRARAE